MRKIEYIYVHHSDSEWGTMREINKWHKANGWSGIGYHFVIGNGIPTYDDLRNNRCLEAAVGNIEYGRPLDLDKELEDGEIGAHVYGKNSKSVGICLIHKNKPYRIEMLITLGTLIKELMVKFDVPLDNVLGHYESEPAKPDCPGIDMGKFRSDIIFINDGTSVIGPFSVRDVLKKYIK